LLWVRALVIKSVAETECCCFDMNLVSVGVVWDRPGEVYGVNNFVNDFVDG